MVTTSSREMMPLPTLLRHHLEDEIERSPPTS